MSDTVDLNTFPKNHCESLAILYLQNQDLSGKSPQEICEMYWTAYYEISSVTGEMRKKASANRK